VPDLPPPLLKVRPLVSANGTNAATPGAEPLEKIRPEPIWIERPYREKLEGEGRGCPAIQSRLSSAPQRARRVLARPTLKRGKEVSPRIHSVLDRSRSGRCPQERSCLRGERKRRRYVREPDASVSWSGKRRRTLCTKKTARSTSWWMGTSTTGMPARRTATSTARGSSTASTTTTRT
jgi:hypothetical protein